MEMIDHLMAEKLMKIKKTAKWGQVTAKKKYLRKQYI
jgi:hypothetical protein